MTVSGHLHVIKHTNKLNSLPHNEKKQKEMSINKLMGIFIASSSIQFPLFFH